MPPSTARIQFSDIIESDLPDLLALDSDPEVMRYLSDGVPSTRDDYLGPDGYLSRMCAYSEVPLGYFAARVDGVFAGWFHLRPSIFDSTIPELGYRLSRPYWNRGLATEGSRELCRWAFDDLRFGAVDACTVPENQRSIRVMQKCGMIRIGSKAHPRMEAPVEHYQVTQAAWATLA